MKRVRQFPDVTVLAFHDDISLVAPVRQLDSVLRWSQEHLRRIGAKLQLAKCTILHHPEVVSEVAQQPNLASLARTTEGLCLHGVPMGTTTYVAQQTRRLPLEHERLIEGILRLSADALPQQLCLFRYCASGRSTYFLRALDNTAGAVLAREVDARSLQVLSRLCGPLHDHPFLSAGDAKLVQAQIQLPCRWGGLGFSSQARVQPAAAVDAWLQLFRGPLADLTPTLRLKQLLLNTADPATSPTTLTALAAEIRHLLRTVSENLPADCSPSVARTTTWDGLLNQICAQRPTPPTETTADDPPRPLTRAQRAFANVLHCVAYQDIIDYPTVPAYARSRLRSATAGASATWFRDIPSASATFVTTQQLITNIRQLLGVPLTAHRPSEPCSSCRHTHDVYGYQLLHRCSRSTRMRIHRHNELVRTVARPQ
uniref:Uncharacterized protein n=1 Tax=Rhodosorus marinus TaxID=101924 RepID=A0A7S0G1T9_9RHOD|mmetsp:Transcript_13988/g.20330  ORF Transcript_13988/g.20330 Transcript_13988/m.20330 type:complete len:427 (+) Transcript_13988:194-1474(+)